MINYGVKPEDVMRVAGHLLDNIIQSKEVGPSGADYYNRLFRIPAVRDEWGSTRRLTVTDVRLVPLASEHLVKLESWVNTPIIQKNFYPPFPTNRADLKQYFADPERTYFAVIYTEQPVGIIGAERIDHHARKLEMRKLIGESGLRGKGIGKRATFLFLYYVFEILDFNKVYLRSLDINLRNLNLNSHFGFELEGVFFEDARFEEQWQDVVRMGLRAPMWRAIFS
jgi:RimJ/RimL family protein N-acetyltransferase